MAMSSAAVQTWHIGARIAALAARHPDRPALTVNGNCWAYWELLAAAGHLAARLAPHTAGPTAPVVAVLADRQPSSYIGILAALLAGNTYVPLNVNHPPRRNLQALRRSGATQVVCGASAAACLEGMLREAPELRAQLKIVRTGDEKTAFPLMFGRPAASLAMAADATAYILFTSGSTGEPKGVPISHDNLTAYLDAVEGMMDVTPDDRLSQTFELTFDLSMHDLLVSWTRGAHLVVPQACDLASPADFIREHAITCWFSVPTLAYQIQLQGRLEPGAFPSLRWSLFCGEALPMDLAQRWIKAAPGSKVENWYGPTEATIACARFNLNGTAAEPEAPNDLAPIGYAFAGMTLTVVDEELRELPPGIAGELLLSGLQVAPGYLQDPERTGKSFIHVPGRDAIHYRTGDRAVCDGSGKVWFLGRVDNQVKIRGFRVELGAIESVVRSAAGAINTIAMSWPPGQASGSSVVVALETEGANTAAILHAARAELPDYMVPSRIVCLQTFPTNASGKADRKAIANRVQQMFANEHATESLGELTATEQALMDLILRLNPQLDAQSVLLADDLLAAGMDSLNFVRLTVELEKLLAVSITQELVVQLAETPFVRLIETVKAGEQPPAAPATVVVADAAGSPARGAGQDRPRLTNRANRVLQFIARFPAVVREGGRPLVAVVGSSGAFRAFVPQQFDAAAARHGLDWRSLNIGLPAIDCESITRICHFIRQQCEEAGVRVPLAIYELDPILLSSVPPKGDIQLVDAHFQPGLATLDSISDDFRWTAAAAGAPVSLDSTVPPGTVAQAKWQLVREHQIAHVFLGALEMRQAAADWWLAGLQQLQAVADKVVVFVHPLDRASLRAISAKPLGEHWPRLLASLQARTNAAFIDWERFNLDTSDFMDINHVKVGAASGKLTEQLATMIFAEI